MQPVTMLVGLNEDACADLLAAATLGRVGVIVDGRPEIFPVCPVYEPSTGSIAFPTNVGTKLSAALHWPFVSFEIDGVDTDGRCGWSVLVTGHAEEVTSPVGGPSPRGAAVVAVALAPRGPLAPDRAGDDDRPAHQRLRPLTPARRRADAPTVGPAPAPQRGSRRCRSTCCR